MKSAGKGSSGTGRVQIRYGSRANEIASTISEVVGMSIQQQERSQMANYAVQSLRNIFQSPAQRLLVLVLAFPHLVGLVVLVALEELEELQALEVLEALVL